MTSKIYSPEEAKAVKERISSINKISKNKKAIARQQAEKLKADIEIDTLINHDDKLYFESLDIQ
jgi:hypothetical protein